MSPIVSVKGWACLADRDNLSGEGILVVVGGSVHIVRNKLLVIPELDRHDSL